MVKGLMKQLYDGIWIDDDAYKRLYSSDNILQIRIGKCSISIDMISDDQLQSIQGVSEDL